MMQKYLIDMHSSHFSLFEVAAISAFRNISLNNSSLLAITGECWISLTVGITCSSFLSCLWLFLRFTWRQPRLSPELFLQTADTCAGFFHAKSLSHYKAIETVGQADWIFTKVDVISSIFNIEELDSKKLPWDNIFHVLRGWENEYSSR